MWSFLILRNKAGISRCCSFDYSSKCHMFCLQTRNQKESSRQQLCLFEHDSLKAEEIVMDSLESFECHLSTIMWPNHLFLDIQFSFTNLHPLFKQITFFVLGDKHYCPGFYDKHGIWNNGFYCPMWGTADTRYCCGVETSRYCCQRPEDREASGSSDTP